MQLLDTLRFRRNLLGYVEESCVSIYHEWVRGVQYFVVHPHHNETDEPWDAQRYAMYMVDTQSVNEFMKLFRESWVTGEALDVPESVIWYNQNQVYHVAYPVDDDSDENIYRIVVREHHWQFWDDRFVVDNLIGDSEQPALRELRVGKHVRSMLFPLPQAEMTALCLSCINVESMWCNTNRRIFTNPEIVIQGAPKVHLRGGVIEADHWKDFKLVPFVGFDWVLQFNGDFTDATVTQIK